jgi:signal recognition particle receptor subunit beta
MRLARPPSYMLSKSEKLCFPIDLPLASIFYSCSRCFFYEQMALATSHFLLQVASTPTLGLDIEQVVCNNLCITSWDVGGGNRIRLLWRYYYAGISALIFVVDCNDHASVENAREQLNLMLHEPQLRSCPLLVLANKQDVPNPLSASDLAEMLNLKNSVAAPWHIQPCSGLRGDGLHEGLAWIEAALHLPSKLQA